MAARVVPQDAGPQHLVRGIQQRRPVHLPRQTDPAQLAQAKAGKLIQHNLCRGDPVAGFLFGPSRMGAGYGQGRAGFGQHDLTVIHQHPFQPRGAQIKTKIHQ
jgi:hypothetical protein